MSKERKVIKDLLKNRKKLLKRYIQLTVHPYTEPEEQEEYIRRINELDGEIRLMQVILERAKNE